MAAESSKKKDGDWLIVGKQSIWLFSSMFLIESYGIVNKIIWEKKRSPDIIIQDGMAATNSNLKFGALMPKKRLS